MEEAVGVALEGIGRDIGGVRVEIRDMRSEFREHVEDDKKIWNEVTQWSGALRLAAWSLGLGIPSILAAVLVNLARHW